MPADTLPQLIAIRRALLLAPAVSAIVERRIYDDVPQPPTYPYVGFGPEFLDPWDAECLDGQEWFPTLNFYSRKRGRTECKRLMHAVSNVLHDNDDLEGFVLLRVESSRIMPRGDGIATHGVMRLRALVE